VILSFKKTYKASSFLNLMIRVVVAFIINEKKVLLIKHKRKGIWLPIGGHVEKGETDLEALKREVKEEVGLEIIPPNKPFWIMEETNEITPHYVCESAKTDVKICKKEIDDFKWFSKEEIVNSDIREDVKKIVMKMLDNI